MLRTVDIAEYWRYATKESKEFQKIAEAENPEFYLMWLAMQRVLDNQFIDTMDDYGLSKWEQFLKVSPYATDTIADRRFRIKALLMGDLPYTMRSLKQKLENICGEGNVQIGYIKSEFLLQIGIALIAKSNKIAVENLLKRILPANIILNLDLIYNKHETLSDFRHSELRRYTHNELRTEVLTHQTNAEGYGVSERMILNDGNASYVLGEVTE